MGSSRNNSRGAALSAIALATGESPVAMGSAHPLNAPYQAFRTADGWINVGAANQTNWERLVDLMGASSLQQDARFRTNDGRMAHRDELVAALNRIFETRSTRDWLACFDQGGVPAGPILSIKQMHRHPQTLAREMIVETEHPTAGAVSTVGTPLKFSATPGKVNRPAPLLGEHTVDVLAEAGFQPDEIERIRG